MFFTKKYLNNLATQIRPKSWTEYFADVENQVYMTKYVYQRHMEHFGMMPYLHFKCSVPARMRRWIAGKAFAGEHGLDYINQKFLADNADLWSAHVESKHVPFKKEITVCHQITDDGHVIPQVRRPEELTVQDIQCADLWAPQPIAIDNACAANVRRIRTPDRMVSRFVDRTGEGFLDHSMTEWSAYVPAKSRVFEKISSMY